MRSTAFLFVAITLSCLFSTTLGTCSTCHAMMSVLKELCLKEGVSTGCPKAKQSLQNQWQKAKKQSDKCTEKVCFRMFYYWEYIVQRFGKSDNDPINMCACGIPEICASC
ncbi:hypothetical protein L596_016840 [Steinernema carpocapsae]|uniref:Saposin B-type domain-containing protein n=1 Tax=Steinernema carpocapsae TaxID=34508 RepID=A0A4V6A3J0_STECR|nr:hypothetical protein L596_016840 [Steinernema carpocapsae]